MNFRRIKKILAPLIRLPIHPQWHTTRHQQLPGLLRKIADQQNILDIGCYNKWAAQYLPVSCQYIGLDYPITADNWYLTKPDVYGDAQSLPIRSDSIDNVLMLDVLEHIEDIGSALMEAYRVLKKTGILVIQIPFMYPIHDSPRDYRRLTEHGIHSMAAQHGFIVMQHFNRGHPFETIALLKNIALLDACINWIKAKNPLSIIIVLAPLYILCGNLLSLLLAKLAPTSNLLPFSYVYVLKKQ